MNPDDSSIARAALIEAVENQIRDNNPPKVRRTLERLLASGMSRDEAVNCIASALIVEIFDVIKNLKEFNPQRYDSNLDKLPDIPWEGN